MTSQTGGFAEPDQPPATRALPVLLGLGATWGASFLFIKVVVEDTGPMELVAGRMSFGMLAIWGIVLWQRRKVVVTPRLALQVGALSFLTHIIPFMLISWGVERISSGSASILNATVPIFTAAFAAALLDDEYFTGGRAFGLLLAFAGVAVLAGEGVLDITDSSVLGQLACVAAAACYGVGAVLSRQMMRGQDATNLSLLQLTLGTACAIPIMLAVTGGAPDFHWDPEAYASIVVLGVAGTGIGYIAFLWLINTIGSVKASLVTYLVPVIAVILGWAVLDESIGVNTVAGGLLIVGGVASVMRDRGQPARHTDVPAAVGE